MTRLSKIQQGKAEQFIRTSARPLEQRMYSYFFEKGNREDVLSELSKYQNADGGFGNALEPDMRIADSSALTSSIGLRILRELQVSYEHDIVGDVIIYLLDTYDAARNVWQVVPSTTNDAPHAPWMGYDDKLPERWGGFLANPRASIVASLQEYAPLVPEDMLKGLLEASVSYLRSRADSLDMHEIGCYMDFLQIASLPGCMRESIVSLLASALERLIDKDSSKWEQYGLRPLDVVSTPDSPFISLFPEAVAANLDYLVEGQEPDGAWPITWSWGDAFPDMWPVAEREWKGIKIVENMKALRAFDRLR